MTSATLKRKEPKCPGFYSELRNELAEVSEMFSSTNPISLEDTLELLGENVLSFDPKYGYFDPHCGIRKPIDFNSSSSLIPFHDSFMVPSEEEIKDYLIRQMNNSNKNVISHLSNSFDLNSEYRLDSLLKKEKKRKILNDDQRIYLLNGIGGISPGFMEFGGKKDITSGTRRDTPFAYCVYDIFEDRENLISTIGFWAQNDVALVSQIQFNSNGFYASEKTLGIWALDIAEEISKELGFKELQVYKADKNPLFLEDPTKKSKLKGQLKCLFDGSCRKLKYERDNSKGIFYKKL